MILKTFNKGEYHKHVSVMSPILKQKTDEGEKELKIRRYGSSAEESIKIPPTEFSLVKEAGSHYVNAS